MHSAWTRSRYLLLPKSHGFFCLVLLTIPLLTIFQASHNKQDFHKAMWDWSPYWDLQQYSNEDVLGWANCIFQCIVKLMNYRWVATSTSNRSFNFWSWSRYSTKQHGLIPVQVLVHCTILNYRHPVMIGQPVASESSDATGHKKVIDLPNHPDDWLRLTGPVLFSMHESRCSRWWKGIQVLCTRYIH